MSEYFMEKGTQLEDHVIDQYKSVESSPHIFHNSPSTRHEMAQDNYLRGTFRGTLKQYIIILTKYQIVKQLVPYWPSYQQ